MALSVQIANTIYDGSYALPGGSIQQIDVGVEVNAVRPVTSNGYVNLVWSASFVINSPDRYTAYWDSRIRKGLLAVGWYEVLYGTTVMFRRAIDDFQVGTEKITGVYDGFTTNRPGDTYVKGNGATLVSVNIGSDRPYRGDVLRYYIKPGMSGTIYLAVNTGFIDNLTDANKYIIHP